MADQTVNQKALEEHFAFELDEMARAVFRTAYQGLISEGWIAISGATSNRKTEVIKK